MTSAVFKPISLALEVARSPAEFADYISSEYQHLTKHGLLSGSDIPIHFSDDPAHRLYYDQHRNLRERFALVGTPQFYLIGERDHYQQLMVADALNHSAVTSYISSGLTPAKANARASQEMSQLRSVVTDGLLRESTGAEYYLTSHDRYRYSMSRCMLGLSERLNRLNQCNVLLGWECDASLLKVRRPIVSRRTCSSDALDCKSNVLKPQTVRFTEISLRLPPIHEKLAPQLISFLEERLLAYLSDANLEFHPERHAFHLVKNLHVKDIMRLPGRFNTLAVVEHLNLHHAANGAYEPQWRKLCDYELIEFNSQSPTIRIGGYLQLW